MHDDCLYHQPQQWFMIGITQIKVYENPNRTLVMCIYYDENLLSVVIFNQGKRRSLSDKKSEQFRALLYCCVVLQDFLHTQLRIRIYV